ncbi:MAG: hypothetical protein KC416_10040 [Myxococcales bacterium]|nr:hypothetical protein [Myxococcales bacterium]
MNRHTLMGIGGAVAMMLVGVGCEDVTQVSEGACGPCGTVATGDVSVSGVAELDGFFSAVADLGDASASIRGDFDADIKAIAEAFGVAEAEVDADFVKAVVAEIKAEVSANAEGGLVVNFQPPSCKADVNVAFEAQAKCEVKAGCEVDVDPGKASFTCMGECQGSCEGECSGELACEVEVDAGGVTCEGACEGSCELEAAAKCEGTCRGECDGTCSATDANGKCAGSCSGDCDGTCELKAKASCMGTCHGKCFVDPPMGMASCDAKAKCSGSCSGQCTGSCKGEFEPPSASASCEASADCKAQAKAQAEAKVECTPPTLDIDFAFKASVDASAQAAFLAKLDVLKVRGRAILQGAARLEALVTGKVNGEVVFETSPLANVTAELEAVVDAGVSGDIDIAPGRIACVIPAFEASISTLATVGKDAQGTIAAQAEFVSAVGGGFN